MTFIERKTTEYYYICDKCGARSFESAFPASSPHDARAKATQEGWKLDSFHNGLDVVNTHLCPRCVAQEIAEQERA